MTPDTVPLSEHLELARVVLKMLKAQRAYFDRKKATPHIPPDPEWRAVRDAEKVCRAAVEDALARDRQTLPGMEGGDVCPAR